MKTKLLLLTAAVSLLIAAAAASMFLGLPRWISWQEKTLETETGTVTLSRKQVTVSENGEPIWQSGPEIKVQDVLVCDLDREEGRELLLLCWKRGRYGKSRPFWVEQDERTWSQHIFIYALEDEKVRPIWMASDIGREVERWQFDPAARLILTDRQGRRTAWDWLSWGLTNIPLQEIRLAAVGDNLIHRQLYDHAFREENGSFLGQYEAILPMLAQYDAVSVNQETPLVEEPSQYSSYPVFGTPLEAGEALAEAGFRIVTCATNHALDQGVEGVARTAAFFNSRNMICTGIQLPNEERRPWEVLEENGLTCALLSYTAHLNGRALPKDQPNLIHTLADEQQIRRELLQARQACDVVLVYVHWGTEYESEPDPEQRRWAKIFADCGADVVIGTHPHVLQPVEILEGEQGSKTLVFYSLGNLISAQTEPACRKGGLASFTVTAAGVLDWDLQVLVTREQNGRYRVEPENR